MKYFFFLICFFKLHASFVGNPLNPTFYQEGLLTCGCKGFSMRVGYLQEYIYKGKYEDEFKTIESTNSDNSLSTYGGLLTFNFLNRVDDKILNRSFVSRMIFSGTGSSPVSQR